MEGPRGQGNLFQLSRHFSSSGSCGSISKGAGTNNAKDYDLVSKRFINEFESNNSLIVAQGLTQDKLGTIKNLLLVAVNLTLTHLRRTQVHSC